MPEFASYQDIDTWMTRARNFSKGRPVRSWGRIVPDPASTSTSPPYLFLVHQNWNKQPTVFRVYSDNIVEWLYTGGQMKGRAHSLVAYLMDVFPFAVARTGKQRYNVYPLARRYSDVWNGTGYEVYPGLKFNMLTGEVLNPKPTPETSEVSPEARRVWLRALRKFKRVMRTRIKLGAINPELIDRGRKLRREQGDSPDWAGADADMLYAALTKDEYPDEFMVKFAATAHNFVWWSQQVQTEHLYKALDDMTSTASIEMRRRFGVFV
jgi:hypothetical protein